MVDNQHQKIRGYRDLSQEEIDLMNSVKDHANRVGDMIAALGTVDSLDKEWLDIGKTALQQGFMAVVRSIAQPESF